MHSWRRGVVVRVVRRMNEVIYTSGPVSTGLGWVTIFGWVYHHGTWPANQVKSALHTSGVAISSTSFGWGKRWNVTSAGWQVTLCDPIWHASSSSGVATSVSELLYPCYFVTLLHVFSCKQYHHPDLTQPKNVNISVRKSIQPVKIEWWGAGMVICLELGVNVLRMIQLTELLSHLLLLHKIHNGLTFLVPAYPGCADVLCS